MSTISPYISATDVASSIPFDNSTNGFSSTDVQSAIEESQRDLLSSEVTSTTSISAPTSTDALMTGMTLTPAAGSYICWFSCDISSGVAGAAISVSLYIGNTQVASSLRKVIPRAGGLLSGTGRVGVSINQTITVNGSQTVQARWSTSNNGPTAAARALTLLRVG